MMRTKAVSLLLSLSLLGSLAIPGTLALPTRAVGEQENNGMVISKTAEANNNGTYTITLEAYATGDKIITETKKDIPTDIILVLDQSGSMDYPMSSERAYSAYENMSNRYLRQQRFNNGDGNLYYPVDGGYVQVQVDRNTVNGYEALSNQTTNYDYYYYSYYGKLYIKDANGQYQEVTVNRTWNSNNFTYTYTITVNGQEKTIGNSTGRNEIPNFGDYGPIYRAGQGYEYTYYYQLAGQDRVVIETSFGEDTVPNETYYQYGTVNTSRLQALKSAVTTFANSVATKAAGPDGILGNADDVNHRVAVVGFASRSGYGNNTELLSISGSNSGNVGVAYGSITNQNLVDVLQDMDKQAGQTMVTNAINALAAEGATQADLGMDMANRILNANPVSQGEKRTRVVVFFTDGSPTSYDTFEQDVADAAISNASQIKSGGAYVYSVGVFPGADATANGIATNNDNRRENQFMQSVSSNNGTVQNPSYYLSAADAGTLNSIFQQISDQIETGGSSSTLTSDAVVKDIISPYFTLPAGTTASDIRIDTYACTGKDGNTYTWSGTSGGSGGASATVNGDQVSVTGFDFSENWCGTEKDAQGNTTVRGKKLVISFEVSRKSGFLGGNDVITNASAGIYENGSAQTPVMTFEQPTVNVPIKPVTVTATDKNVYLKGEVTADQLKDGSEISVGDVKLDLTKENYGLEGWQTEYVDIKVEVKDAKGNVISDKLDNLTDDTTYTVTVTVSPKTTEPKSTEGTKAEEQSGSSEGKINVFKPELTFKDSTAYYGDTAPTDFSGNLTNTEWKHGETKSTDSGVTMIGTAPTLDLTYTPEAGKIAGRKINTKEDISVDVSVKIGTDDVTDETSFVHTKCDETCTDPANGKFWIHVNTCTLNITKQNGANDESYVFDVYKDGVKYSEVTVWGNGTETIVELPVGTYTIEEGTGWSWRYTANNGGSAALTAQSPTGSITCTNTKINDQWLNGFSTVVRNIFGFKN